MAGGDYVSVFLREIRRSDGLVVRQWPDGFALRPHGQSRVGERCRVSDRGYWMGHDDQIEFDVVAKVREAERTVILLVGRDGEEPFSVDDGDYTVAFGTSVSGISRLRRLRLHVGNSQETIGLLHRSQDKHLSTFSPGWRWMTGTAMALVCMISLAAIQSDLGPALTRSGLASDAWGVVILGLGRFVSSLVWGLRVSAWWGLGARRQRARPAREGSSHGPRKDRGCFPAGGVRASDCRGIDLASARPCSADSELRNRNPPKSVLRLRGNEPLRSFPSTPPLNFARDTLGGASDERGRRRRSG